MLCNQEATPYARQCADLQHTIRDPDEASFANQRASEAGFAAQRRMRSLFAMAPAHPHWALPFIES